MLVCHGWELQASAGGEFLCKFYQLRRVVLSFSGKLGHGLLKLETAEVAFEISPCLH